MAVFQLDIEKVLNGEYWTNVYYLRGGALAEAVPNVSTFVALERAIHGTQIQLTKARLRSVTVGDEVYQTIVINQPGLNDVGLNLLPLFNVIRVDFQAVGGGRPSRKYYRTGIPTTEVVGVGNLGASEYNLVQSAIAAAFGELEGIWVDVDDQLLEQGVVQSAIGMRQLRKGSKRRAVPVL